MLAYHLTGVQASIKVDKLSTLTFHEEKGQ